MRPGGDYKTKGHPMNRKIIVTALVAAFVATSSPAFSQDRNDRNDRNDRGNRGQEQRDQGRGNDRANNQDRGAGPRHDMRRGGRVAPEYRSKQYVVDDWRGHQLSAPPRGYHWVQTGGDYVLAAIATGVIMQILLNNY
jgi:Ni/Co efflux regulator RcnB